MDKNEAERLETEFFAFMKCQREGPQSAEIFYTWWLDKVKDNLWALELVDISNVLFALYIASELYDIPLPDDVIKEGRENMVKVLERGGYGDAQQ